MNITTVRALQNERQGILPELLDARDGDEFSGTCHLKKKINKVSALHHTQSKPSQRAKKVAVLSTSHYLHLKIIDDGEEKPQIINSITLLKEELTF